MVTIEYSWPTPLEKGIFLRRYQRFFAEIDWNGKKITAHVPNTGSLLGLLNVGCEALIEKKDQSHRKLSWSLKALRLPSGTWVGVDTQIPHHLLKMAFDKCPHLIDPAVATFKTEVKVSPDTRFDGWYQLESGEEGFIEVKNITLGQLDPTGNAIIAQFPDAPTARGLKHLHHLIELRSKGYHCQLILIAQRDDVDAFSPSEKIDPKWSATFYEAYRKAVQIKCWSFSLDERRISLRNSALKIMLPPPASTI